jgi:Trypsin
MRTLLRLFAAAAAAAALGVTPAGAVIGGSPDGNAHPYVGVSVYYDANGVPLWGCSGTLVSPTLYVTAGHCAGPEEPGAPRPASAQIWFTSGPPARGNYPGHGASCSGYVGFPCRGDVTGLPVAAPGWNGTLPDHDLGVVQLATPMPSLGHATLAPLGYLDGLATKRGLQNVNFTVVGYGNEVEGPTNVVAIPMRNAGTTQLQNVTDIDVLMTASNGNGTGGSAICFGDSGGPVLNGGYLVAQISFTTKYCNGNSGAFRLDTAAAQGFIAAF